MWLCCAQKWILSEKLVLFVNALQFNTRTYTQIHTPAVVQGGERLIELLLINKMRYILWVVALLEVYHVTNNDRHLGLCQELEIRLKPRGTDIFLVLGHLKQYINKHFVLFYPPPLLLLLKDVEKHAFSLKNGLTSCYL